MTRTNSTKRLSAHVVRGICLGDNRYAQHIVILERKLADDMWTENIVATATVSATDNSWDETVEIKIETMFNELYNS